MLGRHVSAKHDLRIWLPQNELKLEHTVILDASKTRAGNIQIQASWAVGGWKTRVARILGLLNDRSAMVRLGLMPEQVCKATDMCSIVNSFVCHTKLTAIGRTWSLAQWDSRLQDIIGWSRRL